MNLYNESNKPRMSTKYNLITDNNYEEVEYISRTGLDLNDGIIYIFNDITSTTLFEIIVKVRAIQSFRDSDKYKGDVNAPITLLISSAGGSIIDMLAIIDFIRASELSFNTICRGIAYSAAAIILASGTGTRAMSTYSSIMFHQGSSYGLEGKFTDLKASVAHSQIIDSNTYSILASVTKQNDSAWWREKMQNDFYLSATEALELGVIDVIL